VCDPKICLNKNKKIKKSVCYTDLTLNADDVIDAVYFNGIQVPNSSMPYAADINRVDTVAMPTTTSVIAIKLANVILTAGFQASTSNGCVATNTTWRCTTDTPPTNWYTVGYNDSNWPHAFDYNGYGGSNFNAQFTGLFSSASTWIWTSNQTIENQVIYCRFQV